MNVLICNVGSTSLKYQLFRMPEELVAASGGAERVGTDAGRFYAKTQENGALVDEAAVFPTHREAIERMLLQLQQTVLPDLRALDCVGFKVVLARGVSGVQLLTDDVLARMEDFSSIAPAHNPPYLAAIRQFRALLPNTPLIGAFETAFHRTMPPEAYYYSIPIDVSRKYDIRRNGFHGASIEYLTEWTQERMGRTDLKLVVCHLGGSGSICAVKDGRSIDTSLGLTLQCGTMHNNRCGDIDPYIIFYLVESCGMTLEEVKALDAGAKFSPEFAGERVPTLEETLKLARSLSDTIRLGVEIKDYDEATVDKTVPLLKEYGFFEGCWFYCFNAQILKYIKQRYNGRTMGYPDFQMSGFEPDSYDYYDEIGIAMNIARSEVYGVYAGKGKPVHIYCADNDADVEFALSLSPALITANDPPALMRALGRM